MLEILILYRLCKRIGEVARGKGRRAIGYQLMLILFWFGGEVCSALSAGVVLALLYGEKFQEYALLGYIAAFVGAGLGAWLAFQIVAGLPAPVCQVAELPEPVCQVVAEPRDVPGRQDMYSLRSLMIGVLAGPPLLVCFGIVAAAIVSLVPNQVTPDNITTEYAQAQTTIRVTVMFAGLLVLVWGGILLHNSLSQDSPAPASRILGFSVLAIGLGAICYGVFGRHDYFLNKQYYLSSPSAQGEHAPSSYNTWESNNAIAKRRELARKASYNEALNGFQWSMSLAGVAVFVLGILSILYSKQTIVQVIGLVAFVAGAGIAVYPWMAFAPIK
jgi:hypothetical protein